MIQSVYRHTLFGLALLLTLLSLPAQAAQSDPKALFQEGMRLFKQGQTTQAIKAFEAAQRSGLKHPALDYNLGVAYYRSGRYTEACIRFAKAAEAPKFVQLGHYNLGLCTLKQGQVDQARAWFEQAATGPQEKLRQLARYQLLQLPPSAEAVPRTVFSLGFGYDDNVLDPATLTGESQSDQFLELFLNTRHPLGAGWELGASLFHQDYFDINAYDLSNLKLGAERATVLAGWDAAAGFDFAHSQLDGDPYLDTLTLTLRTEHARKGSARWRTRLRASQISAGDSTYEPLQGQRLSAELRWQNRSRDLSGGYELEWNDRDDYQDATTFSSYSPLRHTLNLGLEHRLARDWQGRITAHWQNSHYADPNLLSDGSRLTREDELLEWELGLERFLGPQLVLDMSLITTDNESNIDSYDYNRKQWRLALNYLWR